MKLDLQRAHESLGRNVPSVFPLHLRGEMRQQSARKNLSDERRRGLCGVARPGLAVESQDVSAFATLAQALAEAGVSSAIGVRAFATAAVAVGIAAVM